MSIIKFSFFILFLYFICLSGIKTQDDVQDLKEHVDSVCSEPDHKHFSQTTLAYITPWNSLGFETVLKYSAKFDIISPCWFDIKPETLKGKFNSKIDGANYVNSNFMNEMREKRPEVKILPRFKCEGFNLQTYEEWLNEENSNQFLRILIRRLKHNKLDGLVLECNHVWIMDAIYPNFAIMIKKLYEALKKEKMTLVLTIFPYSESFVNILSKLRFEYVSKYTDYFSVMTYDYLSYLKTDKTSNDKLFNAPLSWIKKTLEFYVDHSKPNKSDLLKKILLGLPFHGFQTDTSGKESKLSILDSSAYSNIVLSGRVENFRWDKEECEHLIEMDGNKSLAMFPTKKFIKERLEFCKTNNLAGVAVWDIGLGLESFLDEF